MNDKTKLTGLIKHIRPAYFLAFVIGRLLLKIMITKIEQQKFEAKMSFGNGYSDWLPVVKMIDKNGQEEIIFCRNEHHVHAWHCNSLSINDYRVLEVRPLNAL